MALGLHQHGHGWSTLADEDCQDGALRLMPPQPSSLLGTPQRKGVSMHGVGSFQMGFLGGRMEKACEGRR